MKISCLNCNKEFEAKKHKQKFCSKSCSASYNNKGKRRHGKAPVNCLNCGEKLATSKAKYCSNKCQGEYAWQLRVKEIERRKLFDHRTMKKYLIYKYGNRCLNENCGWDWDKPCNVDLEHIDGNSQNNSLDNLTLLCPNCHSLTPTYKGRNRGSGRHKRRERYKQGKSY